MTTSAAPKVSIVVQVRDRARFVEAALRSVLDQTYRDLEVVIFDDLSTDGSLEICQRIAANDARVRLLPSERRGYGGGWSVAHRATRGLYVGAVDSDDLLMPTAIEETVAVLDDNPDAGMVYTDAIDIDRDGWSIGKNIHSRVPYSCDALLTTFITFHFRLLRRTFVDQAGGFGGGEDEETECVLDYDLSLRMSEVAPVLHLPAPLYLYRLHGSNLSATRRYAQVIASRTAVRRALERRGLSNQLDFRVEVSPGHLIEPLIGRG